MRLAAWSHLTVLSSSARALPLLSRGAPHRRCLRRGAPAVRRLATMARDDDAATPTPTRRRPPGLVDADCNLLHPDLIAVMQKLPSHRVDDGVDDALQILHHPSTTAARVVAVMSPSSTVEESERSCRLLRSATPRETNGVQVLTTVGVHPYHAREVGAPEGEPLARLRALLDEDRASGSPVIGCVGETGLDYSEGFPDREDQLPWFRACLDLAFEYSLPVFLHERLAFDDTLRCLDEAIEKHGGTTPVPKIIVHCFTGTGAECEAYMKRGMYASVSGYICKAGDGSAEVRRCLREGIIPPDRLLIETDAPYLGFPGNKDAFVAAEGDAFAQLSAKKRKKLKGTYPNVPSALPRVLAAVTEELNAGRAARGEGPALSEDEVARITTANACRFFGFEDPEEES